MSLLKDNDTCNVIFSVFRYDLQSRSERMVCCIRQCKILSGKSTQLTVPSLSSSWECIESLWQTYNP